MIECCEMVDLYKFLSEAQPNDQFKYYTGYNLEDSILSFQIGKYCYQQAARGIIYLVRRRNQQDKSYFDYIAVRASSRPVYRLIPISEEEFNIKHRIKPGDRRYVRNELRHKPRGAHVEIQATSEVERKEERQLPQEPGANPVRPDAGLSTHESQSNGDGSAGPGRLQNASDYSAAGLVTTA